VLAGAVGVGRGPAAVGAALGEDESTGAGAVAVAEGDTVAAADTAPVGVDDAFETDDGLQPAATITVTAAATAAAANTAGRVVPVRTGFIT
jgi:hypothetical protein